MNVRHSATKGVPCSCPECEMGEALKRIRLIPWIVGVIATGVIVFLCMAGNVGEASYYNEGVRTASGELFDKEAMTCAMPSRRCLGKSYIVTNIKNGKSVVVRCNDIGPNQRLVERGRIIDLTEAAFKKIANLSAGVVRVRVQRFRRFKDKPIFGKRKE